MLEVVNQQWNFNSAVTKLGQGLARWGSVTRIVIKLLTYMLHGRLAYRLTLSYISCFSEASKPYTMKLHSNSTYYWQAVAALNTGGSVQSNTGNALRAVREQVGYDRKACTTRRERGTRKSTMQLVLPAVDSKACNPN